MGLVARKLDADAGRILYDDGRGGGDRDVTRASMDALARAGLVKTNQIVQDFDTLTIRESLSLALTAPRAERFWNVLGPRRPDPVLEAEIDGLLSRFSFSRGRTATRARRGRRKLLDNPALPPRCARACSRWTSRPPGCPTT